MTSERPELTTECPTCHRPPGRQCITRSGHGTHTHADRYRAVGIETTMPKGQFTCNWCSSVFVYELALLRHMNRQCLDRPR